MDLTDVERAAWQDFDQAQAAYTADPSEENRAAYEAATWAAEAAVRRAAEQAREIGNGRI